MDFNEWRVLSKVRHILIKILRSASYGSSAWISSNQQMALRWNLTATAHRKSYSEWKNLDLNGSILLIEAQVKSFTITYTHGTEVFWDT